MKIHLSSIKMKIIGILTFDVESPVHIGIGGEEAVRELVRLSSGEILIPSSTWKGAFRSVSERIAKQANLEGLSGLAVKLYREGVRVSYRGDSEEFKRLTEDFVTSLQSGEPKVLLHKAEELKSLMIELGYSEDDVKEVETKGLNARDEILLGFVEEYVALHCPIGRLYGNMTVSGKVRFIDSFISAGIETRPGVGIDRKSGKVMEKMLQFINVVSRGPIELRMIMDNLLPGKDDSRIFASTLDVIKTIGISIGARKSVGLGNLRLSNGKFYVLDLMDDHKNGKFVIGNPFRVRPIDLDEFIKWLWK
ncbi:MAG: RAMP superfamily CRISPR-associated protein [Thermoproteota archaeon]